MGLGPLLAAGALRLRAVVPRGPGHVPFPDDDGLAEPRFASGDPEPDFAF
jgi:hypothetical protein